MINKKELEKKILDAREIAQKYDLDAISNEFDELVKVNEDYKINVLFVGGFSAGKSALLNCIIGSERLIENQAPETAIATEISYAAMDSAYSVKEDGSIEECSSTADIDPEEYSHLVYNIDSENLDLLFDYILVDTPGFDSGIRRHNKALMNYIGNKGTAYVFVVDCEKGTLSQSALNFLNEVSNYSTDIAVVINKCDKKTEEDIERIKEHINNLIQVNCGQERPIITTSKYDEDAAQKLIDLIKEFRPQALYEKNVGTLVENKIRDLRQALEAIEKNKELDVSGIEDEIKRREKAKSALQEEIKKQQQRMQKKLHGEVKEKILNEISSKLQNDVHSLAAAYKAGVDGFQERVLSIVRPVIIRSIEDYETVAYQDIIRGINVSNLDMGIDGEQVGIILNSVLEKMEHLSSTLSAQLGNVADRKGGIDEEAAKKYKVISSLLAIATDIVAPWLEILIVILPDIINAFMQKIADNKLLEAIQNQVIPQIIANLRNTLDDPLAEVEITMAENLEYSVSELLKAENDALEQAKQRKSSMESDFDDYISGLEADIAQLAD